MRRRLIVAAVVLALAVAGYHYVPRGAAFLRIGTTYAAQQTCACIHLCGRTLDSCVAELGKAGRLLRIESTGDTVRSSALFGAFTSESLNEPPFGCHPVK